MRRSDEEDYTAFVRDVSPGLLATAWALTGDAGTSQDLVRAALARLWPRWREVRRPRPVAVAERELLHRYAAWYRDAPPDDDQPGGRPDRRLPLVEALARLTRSQRGTLVLTEYLGHSVPDVARLLDLPGTGVTDQTAQALRVLGELLDEPGEQQPVPAARVRQRLGRVGAAAPPMAVRTEEVLTDGRRLLRGRRSRLAAVAVTAVAAVAGWAAVSGWQADPEPPPMAVVPPAWDTTRDFGTVVEVDLDGTPASLRIDRPAGAPAFTVESSGAPGPTTSLTPVAGDLPGHSQLLRADDYSVLLTPVPARLQPRHASVLWDPTGDSWGRMRVVADGGQGLLVHVAGQDDGPVEPAQVREVVWVADGTVVTAGGGPVPQATLGYGTEAEVFLLPEHNRIGLVRREFGDPSVLGSADVGDWMMFGVGAAGGDPFAAEQPRMLVAVLPDGSSEATVQLDDATPTQRPMQTVRLGDRLVAWTILRHVDPAQDPAGLPAVSWAGPDGKPGSLGDAGADVTLSFGDGSYRFTRVSETLRVVGGGVVDVLPLRPPSGVSLLTTTTQELAVVTGLPGGAAPLLLPDAPAPVRVPDDRPFVGGGAEGLSVALVTPAAAENHRPVEPLAAVGMARDGATCTLSGPEASDPAVFTVRAGELTGTVLHLRELDAMAVCLGDVLVGGAIEPVRGDPVLVGDDEADALLRFDPPGTDQGAPPGWEQSVRVTLTEDLTVTVLAPSS